MDQLISKIESYSRALSEKLVSEFYSKNEAISGEQILKITPIDQVNLFIVKNLFDKWREESQKLRSPYFDYDKPEVKSAFEQFMAVLSRNISVKREFFKPLIQKAINDSLFLLLQPIAFFESELGKNNSIGLSDFKEIKKYYKWGRSGLDAVYQQAESQNRSIQSTEILQKIKELIPVDVFSPEGTKKLINDFSQLLPFEIPAELNEVKPIQTPPNTFKEETVKVEIKQEVNVESQPEKPKVESESKDKKILNEKFAGNQLTLNDILKSEEAVTLAEKIGKSKVQNIREVISLNQKFMFITALFDGERTEYENALNQIERSATYEEAFQYLDNTFASKYRWENGKPELLEFKELIYRKFS